MFGLTAGLSALFAQPCLAGGISSATILQVLTMQNGVVMIYVSGTPSGHPACATQATRWVIDGSTTAGQALVATALNAYNTKTPVTIAGSNTCTVWGDTEGVVYLIAPG